MRSGLLQRALAVAGQHVLGVGQAGVGPEPQKMVSTAPWRAAIASSPSPALIVSPPRPPSMESLPAPPEIALAEALPDSVSALGAAGGVLDVGGDRVAVGVVGRTVERDRQSGLVAVVGGVRAGSAVQRVGAQATCSRSSPPAPFSVSLPPRPISEFASLSPVSVSAPGVPDRFSTSVPTLSPSPPSRRRRRSRR